MSILGKFGPAVIGEAQYAQEQQVVATGADKFGPGVLGEPPASAAPSAPALPATPATPATPAAPAPALSIKEQARQIAAEKRAAAKVAEDAAAAADAAARETGEGAE